MIKIDKEEELINHKWKTELCSSQGDKCWCKPICAEENIVWRKEPDFEAYIAAEGTINKYLAEHIVKLHNEWLAQKKENDGE